MLVVLVDEVPDNLMNVVLCPAKPVLNGRLNIKHGPTVKLGRVHLANLILLAMLATVDSSKDEGLRMKGETSELPRVQSTQRYLDELRVARSTSSRKSTTGVSQAVLNHSGGFQEVTLPSVEGRPSKSPSVIWEARRSTTGRPALSAN